MPLYEYQCEQCGQVFEVMQKFVDEPLTMHDACGGRLERLMSAPALQFKGSGWYITDYARSGASSGSGQKSEAEGTSKSAPESKGGDTKPSESKGSPGATSTGSSGSDTK